MVQGNNCYQFLAVLSIITVICIQYIIDSIIMNTKFCRIYDCSKSVFSSQLCSMHYARFRRHGADVTLKDHNPRNVLCEICGVSISKGRLCLIHLKSLYYHTFYNRSEDEQQKLINDFILKNRS